MPAELIDVQGVTAADVTRGSVRCENQSFQGTRPAQKMHSVRSAASRAIRGGGPQPIEQEITANSALCSAN
ncbi:hypothetical protein [Bradyrhizobium sp. UFLA05-112]